MKKLYLQWIITIMSFIFPLNSFGQETGNDANTTLPIDQEVYDNALLKSGNLGGVTFKVQLIFPGTSQYNTAANRTMIISRMNEAMSQVGISFILGGYSNIGSQDLDDYWDYPFLYQDRWVVIFTPENDWGSSTAIGKGNVGSPSLKIRAESFFNHATYSQNSYRKALIAHEMGHNLGIKFDQVNAYEIDGEYDYYHSNDNSDVMFPYIAGANYLYSDYEKQIIHSMLTTSSYSRLYYNAVREMTNAPDQIFQGQSITLTAYDESPANYGIFFDVTNSQGGSITWANEGGYYFNVGVIGQNLLKCGGDAIAEETLTCRFRYRAIESDISSWYDISISQPLQVNEYSIPSAPTISYPYNMSTNYYVVNPLETGTTYRFQMSNCGESFSDFDYEWTCDGYADYVFLDINGSDVQDDGTAYGKTCYFKVFEDGSYTLKGRYRENSSSPWSDWATSYLSFEGGEMMMITPNPVSLSSTTISLESPNEEPLDYNEGWELEIVDINYVKKEKEKVKKKEYKLKTHGWKAGTYIVIATYKDKQVTGKLKVE